MSKLSDLKQFSLAQAHSLLLFDPKIGWLVGWFIGFYGISTFVGYLTPNLFLCK